MKEIIPEWYSLSAKEAYIMVAKARSKIPQKRKVRFEFKGMNIKLIVVFHQDYIYAYDFILHTKSHNTTQQPSHKIILTQANTVRAG